MTNLNYHECLEVMLGNCKYIEDLKYMTPKMFEYIDSKLHWIDYNDQTDFITFINKYYDGDISDENFEKTIEHTNNTILTLYYNIINYNVECLENCHQVYNDYIKSDADSYKTIEKYGNMDIVDILKTVYPHDVWLYDQKNDNLVVIDGYLNFNIK